MWAFWMVGGLVGWVLLGGLVAVAVGRGIRIADRRSSGTGIPRELTTADIPGLTPSPSVPV